MKTVDTYDWPTIQAKANQDLSMFGTGRPTYDSVLRKTNFITSEVLAFVSIKGTCVEVSTTWWRDRRLYGITIDRPFDTPPDKRDRMIETWDEVVAYLKEIAGFPPGT